MRVPHDLDHHLPFTTKSAIASGMSVEELQGGGWRCVMPDVWIAADAAVGRATWRDAARLVLPVDAVLCGLSALSEHGLELRADDDLTVHVSTGVKHRRRSTEIVNHRLALGEDETVVIGRWLVTTPRRTAFDCVRWADPTHAAVVAEAIVQAGLTDLTELTAMAERYPRLHGTKLVRLVAAGLGQAAAA